MDIAISTAAIPGRPSPLLITKEAVSGMKPGSAPWPNDGNDGENGMGWENMGDFEMGKWMEGF